MPNPEACAPTSSHEAISAPTIRLTDLFDGYPLDHELLTQKRMEKLALLLDDVATDTLIESPNKVGVSEVNERNDEAILHAALSQYGLSGLARFALSPHVQESMKAYEVSPAFALQILTALETESKGIANPEQHLRLAQPETNLGYMQQVSMVEGQGFDAMLAAHNALRMRLAPLLEHVNTPQVSRCLR